MAAGDGTRDGGIRLGWPGRPSAILPESPPDQSRLTIAERWPGASAIAGSTLIAGDAPNVLDRWRGGDPLLAELGAVRLIYLDPPFATGTTFSAEIPIGERRAARPALRLPAYRDVWAGGLAAYLTFMQDLLARLRAVLSDDGWLCLHCDHRASAHLRLILDELFGADAFRNEIVWSYGLGNGTSRRGFPRKHDTLLLYAKSDAAVFRPVRGEISQAMANKYRHIRPDGTRFMRSYGREYDLKGGKPVGSVWEIPSIAPTSTQRTGYPTQKPVTLLERLISATTAPGDLVLDPCCGSGTTLIAASRLGRSSAGIDASPLAIAATRTRLVQARVPVVIAGPNPKGGPQPTPGSPIGGHHAAPPRRYMAAASVSAIDGASAGATMLTVTLDDLQVAAQDDPGSARSALTVLNGQLVRPGRATTPLTDHWADWLSGWAVHLGARSPQAATPFVPVASAFRTVRDRTLATSLPVAVPTGASLDQLTVRLYDVFGAWSDHLLPVDPE